MSEKKLLSYSFWSYASCLLTTIGLSFALTAVLLSGGQYLALTAVAAIASKYNKFFIALMGLVSILVIIVTTILSTNLIIAVNYHAEDWLTASLVLLKYYFWPIYIATLLGFYIFIVRLMYNTPLPNNEQSQQI